MPTSTNQPPIAKALLEYHPHGCVWVVPLCPICGKPHQHGGGGLDDNPRDFLGPRRALCVPGDVPLDVDFSPGYVLEEVQP